MKRKGRNRSAGFKAKVALAACKGTGHWRNWPNSWPGAWGYEPASKSHPSPEQEAVLRARP